MNYDAVLEPAGMRLVQESAANGPTYRVEPLPYPNALQRAIRDGWLKGAVTK
jgi:hypothetical protein